MLNEPVLVDTGPLIALYNPNDPHHADCVAAVQTLPVGKAYTCWPVIVEAAHLLRKYPRERERLFRSLAADEFVLLPLSASDLPGIQGVIDKYHDQSVDLADAAIVHLADREEIGVVFTLDRRHFHVFWRRSGAPFALLPELT